MFGDGDNMDTMSFNKRYKGQQVPISEMSEHNWYCFNFPDVLMYDDPSLSVYNDQTYLCTVLLSGTSSSQQLY